MRAVIYVETESQKQIVVGRAGSMVREIGTRARPEVEALLGRHVFLELRVKARPRWRRDEAMLEASGSEKTRVWLAVYDRTHRCATIEIVTSVLIVDDHPSFRASARALLEAEGFDVIGEASRRGERRRRHVTSSGPTSSCSMSSFPTGRASRSPRS